MDMPDGVEGEVMDDEEREALEMTSEELLALASQGEPAQVAHRPPANFNQHGGDMVGEDTKDSHSIGQIEPGAPVKTIYLRPVLGNHPNIVLVRRMA